MAYHESGHAIVASVASRTRPGAQDLDRAARIRRARVHHAAAARGSIPVDPRGSAQPVVSAARRDAAPRRSPSGESRQARRTISASDRHRAGDGHGVRHERAARRGELHRESAPGLHRPWFQPERGNYSEETALKIDSEVKRILTDAHDTARQVLRERRETLDVLSARLLEVGSDRSRRAEDDHGLAAPEGSRRHGAGSPARPRRQDRLSHRRTQERQDGPPHKTDYRFSSLRRADSSVGWAPWKFPRSIVRADLCRPRRARFSVPVHTGRRQRYRNLA